jgi:predicted nucleic acid-binding protein
VRALVFDNSPLSHFTRAGELGTLDVLTEGRRRCVVREVVAELESGLANYPELSVVLEAGWLEHVEVAAPDAATPDEIQLFAIYADRLVSGDRHVGEAATLAWAEAHAAVAVIDDRAGRRHGLERGLEVVGSLNLIADSCRTGQLSEDAAARLVDALRESHAYLPCDGASFVEWARSEGLF